MSSFRRVFRYYWPQIQKYKWSGLAVFLLYGFGIILDNILNPYLYKEVIDLISHSSPSAVLAVELMQIVLWIAAFSLGGFIFYRIGDYAIVYFQANVIREINNDSFRRLLQHSHQFFSDNFAGSLVAKTKRFTSAFEGMHDKVSFDLWFVTVQLLGVFIVLFNSVHKIFWIFLIWTMVYILITIFFIKKKMRLDLLEASADSKVTAHLADSISNVMNVKIFSGRQLEVKTFSNTTRNEYEKRSTAWNFANFQNAVQAILMMGIQVYVIYFMVKMWLVGTITAGTFVLVQFYMATVFRQLWGLGKAMTRFFKHLADANEMVDLLDQVPDIIDSKNSEQIKIASGLIEFKDVSFNYIDNVSVFNNFNLTIKAGEKVGLVGHSGSGKSTITKMLLRFVDLSSGQILIDGQDISKVKQDDLRSKISYVPQESILFHRPIQENIAYAKPSASKEEIINSAKSAHAHEFISMLPHGYDTLVGERGVKLSGGERQRVAIARAMLKDAPILILDEATSSLDSVSETLIQDAFNELMKGKTTIVIAHRLSTIQKMDRIIVLDQGKIVEEGTHKELLAKGGVYADLWNHQTGGFLE